MLALPGTNNGRVRGADDTICAVLIPCAVVRSNKMDDKARGYGAVQGVVNAKLNKPVIPVKYNDGVLTVRDLQISAMLEQCANYSLSRSLSLSISATAYLYDRLVVGAISPRSIFARTNAYAGHTVICTV